MNGHCAVKQRCAVRNLGLYTATMRGTYLGIVLRVHEAVVVVAVAAALVEAVVAAGRILHVDIGRGARRQKERGDRAHHRGLRRARVGGAGERERVGWSELRARAVPHADEIARVY